MVVVILGVVLLMALVAVALTVYVVSAVYRSVVGLFNGDAATATTPADGIGPRCLNAGCRSANPSHARFCRRCGSAMATATTYNLSSHRAPHREAMTFVA